jgi:DNA-binding transcriptional regulator YdaS (Cro superfamily)
VPSRRTLTLTLRSFCYDTRGMNLDQYLSRPGAESMSALARSLGLNADQVRQWRHAQDGRRPSPANCTAIEEATEGGVTCEELRPDLSWSRIADKAWPWSKKGRPVLDLTRAEPAKAA